MPHSFFLRPIAIDDCLKIISDLKNTTFGKNTISVRCFKAVKHLLVGPICQLINLSIETGTFPDCLKCAHITPIFKSGDKGSVSNYRPISVLPLLSKIFEKFVAHRLTVFLDARCVVSSSRFGFRKGSQQWMLLLS